MKSINVFFSVLVIALAACDDARYNADNPVVARVHNTYLHRSELAGLAPPNASASDSIAIVNTYINNWVRNQLILNQAERNLTTEQKDFSRQLNDYRNSLVIYKYESELVRQNLDSLISDAELRDYYEANLHNFSLKEDIVQFAYIKLRDDLPVAGQIKDLFEQGFEDNRDSINFYAIKYGDDYAFLTDQWIPFNRFLSIVPLQITDAESFLEQNTLVEYHAEPHLHMIYFTGYKLKGDISPFDYERDNINMVLLNRRKRLLIKDMHQEIYEQARKTNEIEFF